MKHLEITHKFANNCVDYHVPFPITANKQLLADDNSSRNVIISISFSDNYIKNHKCSNDKS